jgi:hypothetical protein
MPLTDLFNPTFFMFLGILLLVVALVVVYFENKMREQNHKIASMLSLVSTLAEHMNGVKMGLNHLAMTTIGGGSFQPPAQTDKLNTAFISSSDNKITVSDDEDSEYDSDDESELSKKNDTSSELELNSDSDDETSSTISSQGDIKVLKLNIGNEDNNEYNDETLDLEENAEELEYLDDLEDNLSEAQSESSEFVEETLEIHAANVDDDNINEPLANISASDLKTINITLEETNSESIDYKKLPLPKLRTIVSEKGFAVDVAKLKKNELIKLLESE